MTRQVAREGLPAFDADRCLKVVHDPMMRLVARLRAVVTRVTTDCRAERGVGNPNLAITMVC